MTPRRSSPTGAGRSRGDCALHSGAGIRPGLGRELYGAFPVFRAAYDTVRGALDHWLRLPLAAVVFAPEGGVDAALIRRSESGQPALFAFHVAAFRLWQSWRLRAIPLVCATTGRSMGPGPGRQPLSPG
ncbi:hypothetical protein OH786_37000 (plasmid) [Streptomyces atratus]|uniref:Uncharacterized protein n=1 Tax=Streptomyces atratus TaxID=1893 RepID=A0A1K2F2U0_STRAR|nr:hypothetical protein [Streptomyces atratus]SFY42041.1 hypothetical protein SAMN02787144_10299 [Streptomyces atratus]